MMQIDTDVVKALMQLRCVSVENLANLVHVRLNDLTSWLDGESDKIQYSTQIEILHLLGVRDDTLRGDLVHYWTVQESFFSSIESAYGALDVILEVFGPAKLVHISAHTDKAFTTDSRTVFGLRFPTFMALLDVRGHPWRAIRFEPKKLSNLTWVSENPVVGIDPKVFNAIEPGAFKVQELQQHMLYSEEAVSWEQICNAALERGIRAKEVSDRIFTEEHQEQSTTFSAAPVVSTVDHEIKVAAPVETPAHEPVIIAPPTVAIQPAIQHAQEPHAQTVPVMKASTTRFDAPIRRPTE